MALNNGTVLEPSQPVFNALVRLSGNCILACLHLVHVDAHIALDSEAVIGAAASNMGRVSAGDECLGRDTSGIHTGAAKLVAFDNGDGHACGSKPRSERGACLSGPDDDGIEVSWHDIPRSGSHAVARHGGCRATGDHV